MAMDKIGKWVKVIIIIGVIGAIAAANTIYV